MSENHLETAESVLYGRGVFTTIAIRGGQPFLWEKHWRRLTTNAQQLSIDISTYPEDLVRDQLVRSVEHDGLKEGRTRITFADESSSKVWNSAGERKCRLSIITAKRRPIPEHFKLTVSPHHVNTTSPLVGIKSCNYLEHLMAFGETRSRGFDEAVRLNERGEVACACMANVFWSRGGKLFTPSLKTGCLAGTTREFVMENLACAEVEVRLDELNEADQIFLTSAGLGIVTVAEFERHTLLTARHPIMDLGPK